MKAEYLAQLSHRLRVLPASERQDALDYYDGYLSDAENEAAAIAQLGSPGEVAANILANYVSKTPSTHELSDRKAEARGVRTAWMIILALFALPVGLPIIITLATIPFMLFITLLSVIFSFGVTGVALIAAGVGSIIVFPFVVLQDFGTALFFGGTGLICIGLGIWFINLTRVLMRGFPMIARFVAQQINRRRRRGASTHTTAPAGAPPSLHGMASPESYYTN